MHIPILSLRIPWVGYIEFGWQTLLVASVLGFVVYRCGRLGIAYELRRAGLESSRRAAISLAAYDLPSMKKLAAESDPEIDHDREWVSACSVAVDRWVCFFAELSNAHPRVQRHCERLLRLGRS